MGPWFCLIFCHWSLSGGYSCTVSWGGRSQSCHLPARSLCRRRGWGALAKLSGVQNQPTPHLALAQISFLFRLPAHFPFTRYGRREQGFGWRDREGLVSLGCSASLSPENVHELQLLSHCIFHKLRACAQAVPKASEHSLLNHVNYTYIWNVRHFSNMYTPVTQKAFDFHPKS